MGVNPGYLDKILLSKNCKVQLVLWRENLFHCLAGRLPLLWGTGYQPGSMEEVEWWHHHGDVQEVASDVTGHECGNSLLTGLADTHREGAGGGTWWDHYIGWLFFILLTQLLSISTRVCQSSLTFSLSLKSNNISLSFTQEGWPAGL